MNVKLSTAGDETIEAMHIERILPQLLLDFA
jgi:hypothetical protein